MSWIALTDLHRPVFNIRGIGVPADAPGVRGPVTPDEILPTGTLMLETVFQAEPDAPQDILRYRRRRDWVRALIITLSAEGRMRLVVRQGAARSRAIVDFPPPPRGTKMRISYAWDGPNRTARLTVKLPALGQVYQTLIRDPVPLPVVDARVIVRNGTATQISPETRFVAIADTVEPIWLQSGIAQGTLVQTDDGPLAVDRLRLGDLVQTAFNGLQPVRWIGHGTVPALGSFRPVRLRAPYFGLSDDILLGPDHRIRLGDVDSEYDLGESEVLIEARHLTSGKAARRDGRRPIIHYYQVLLDMHDCLLHSGVWSESLYMGNATRDPAILPSTTLSEMPTSSIPVHRGMARRTLSHYEARTVAEALRA